MVKVRSGLVSNSSTSSFIVSAAGEDALRVTVTLQVDLRDYLGDGAIVRSLAELDEWVDDHCWDDAKGEAWYQRAVAALAEGRIVVCGELGYHGDAFEQESHRRGLRELLEGSGVEVVRFDGD